MSELEREEIVHRLEALGRELVPAPGRDLAPRVRARIEASPGPIRRRPARVTRQTLAIGIAGLLLVGGAAVAASPLRDDVLDALGIRGVALEEVPSPPGVAEFSSLALGPRVSAATAERRADFPLVRAHSAKLSRPEAIHVRTLGARSIVSFAYPPGPELPELESSGTGAVLSAFKAPLEPALLKKTIAVGEGERVSVVGAPGYWLGGEHSVSFLKQTTGIAVDTRPASKVLLWRRGPLTLRLEAEVTKAEALELARTVR